MKWIVAILAFLVSPVATTAAPTHSVVRMQVVPKAAIYESAGQEMRIDYMLTNDLGTAIPDDFKVVSMLGVAAVCPHLPSGNLEPGGQLVCTGSYYVTAGDMGVPNIFELAMACNSWLCSDENWALMLRRPLRTHFPLVVR
jgi:hypothetical protein